MKTLCLILAAALPFGGSGTTEPRPQQAKREPTWQICTMQMTSLDLEILAEDVPCIRSLAWKDGKLWRGLFVKGPGAAFLYDFQTKTESPLTMNGATIVPPSLSDDGSKYAFVKNQGGAFVGTIINGNLTSLQFINNDQPTCAWWGDGMAVYVSSLQNASSPPGPPAAPCVMLSFRERDDHSWFGNHLFKLPDSFVQVEGGDFSQQHVRTAAVSSNRLWILDSYGAGSDVSDARGAPFFSRDGEWIAFTNTAGAICVIKSDGTGLKTVGTAERFKSCLGWKGNRIAFIRPTPIPDLKEEMRRSQEEAYTANFPPSKENPRRGDKAANPWVVEPDDKAQGRFGLIRTNWHEAVGSGYQNIFVHLPGKRDVSEYKENFKREHGVMEGEYDISINGAFLEKVPVKAGHSTRILMGALNSTAPYANQLHILDSKDRRVGEIQGGETIALPIGTYQVKVGTRTIKIEIKENEVTKF